MRASIANAANLMNYPAASSGVSDADNFKPYIWKSAEKNMTPAELWIAAASFQTPLSAAGIIPAA